MKKFLSKINIKISKTKIGRIVPEILIKLKSSRIATKISQISQKRQSNSEKYKATNFLLMIGFPLFITTLIEIIQMKTVSKFILFLFEKPSIVLFNILLASMIFITLLFLFKKGWVAVAVMGITLTTLSVVELFKFNTSGNHLILTDMKMAVNVGNLTRFAYIKITAPLVISVAILFIYIGAVFWFNPKLKIKMSKRLVTSGVSFATITCLLVTPSIAVPVYSFFDIDTTYSDNVFRVNEKFDNNNFLAFLAQTTTEFLSRKIDEPEYYTIDTIGEMLIPANKGTEIFKKPNVIMIMSEAFADFRIFDSLEIDPSIYESFDNIRNEGYAGRAVVPAFGSFTVKTEFELMFGLPVKSLNDPNMPQRLLLDREQQTMPRYFNSLGYNTNYIHTFASTFYSRERIFANYGYDNMYFDDDLTVPTEYYEAYISDTTIFNQIDTILAENEDPSFIFTTTMQNHQPYNPNEAYTTQLDYYLAGIKNMTGNLEEFINGLKELDEPTLVFFVGDHFPCFKGEDSIYNQLEINSQNCNELYEQSYFIWSNYDMDYSDAPNGPISAFYMPYVLLDLIDAPKDDLIQTMLDKSKSFPIYTTNYDNTTANDAELDMFTYDIVLGEQYLDEGK